MVGKKRNFGLDIIRAVSIYLVLIAHYFKLSVELGIVGVQIFFVLSGFLIGQIIIHDFREGGNLSTVYHFWRRRWFRTLPMYYLILLLKLLIFGNPFGWKILAYFFFLQANFVGIDFFPVSWSLVVEEWFYLFLPIGILIPFHMGIRPKKFLQYVLFLIAFFFLARLAWNYFHLGVIIYQFDCLLVGVFLAGLKTYYSSTYSKLIRPFIFFLGLGGVVLMTFVLGDMSDIPLFSPFYRVVWYLLTSVFVMFMFPFVENSFFVNHKIKSLKTVYYLITWTSILTYSIYLIHADIFQLDLSGIGYLNIVLHLSILYGAAFVFYSFFEHPMLSLRDGVSLRKYLQSARDFSLRV